MKLCFFCKNENVMAFDDAACTCKAKRKLQSAQNILFELESFCKVLLNLNGL